MTKLVRSLAVLLSCLPLAAALANGAVDVPVRVGSHEGYGRVVFDAPARTDYQLTQQDQRVEVRFANEVTIAAPAGVPHNVLHITGGAGQAELVIAPGTVLRDWRFGDRIVIDIWDAGAAPRQPAGPAKASLPAPQAKDAPAPQPAQAAAPPTQPAAAKPTEPVVPAKPDAAPAPSKPPLAAEPVRTPPLPAAPEAPPARAADQPSPTQGQEPAPAAAATSVGDMAEPADAKPDALVVPVDSQTGLAVFRRGNAALIVFDQRRSVDMTPLHDDPVFGTATVQLLTTATMIRVPLDPTTALAVSRGPDTWRIAAVSSEPKLQPIAASVTDDRLTLTAAAPGSVISVADPDTGATLLVGTQRREGQGIPVERRTAEFILLPTWVGVAIEPNADTLVLRPTQQGFLLTGGTGGLAMSPPSDIGEQLAHSVGLTRQFDFPSQPALPLMQRLSREVAAGAATPALARGPRRRDVARTMISLGLGVEAQAVLRVAAADDPHEAGSTDNAVLGSIAALLARRPDEALGLNDPRLLPADDVALWRAVRLAETREGSPQAAAVFSATLPLLLAYPAEMRDHLLPLVAETLVLGGETATAAALLDARKETAGLDLARGMLLEARGDSAGALAIYDRLTRSTDQLQRARAAVRATELRLTKGELDVRQAADQLDKLLYAWRGDQHELSLRERVAELRSQSGAWRSALSLLRETEALFPENKAAIHAEMQDTFAALLRKDAAATLPPLELVSLVEENTDLLPTGPEGEVLEARLADRLLALELPKRAGPVLEKLMHAAPTGAGRAGFGARLAALRQREGDASGALAALSASAVTDLPAELTERRTLLAAAANARQGDNDHALAALSALDTAAADEARATILERASDWPAAQRALAAYTAKTVPPEGRLNDEQRRALLRLATAAARAGDEAALSALRQKDGPRMESGPLADMFRLLTAEQVRGIGDLKRSGQETALARALPGQLKALQQPALQTP